ncbi:MAG: PAS domain S-box protein [Acetobacteraceae bacterium]|nr:PAS domain S-box protein [Acetobacteraceae bacterium]
MIGSSEAQHSRFAQTDSERQLHVLVDQVTDYAIYMLDPEGNITTWNIGAQRIKGCSAEEVLGRNFSLFYTEEDRRAERHLAALETAKREGRYEAEGWRVRKDGSRFWVNAVVYPVRDEAGNLTGFVKVTRDITERLQQEAALERARNAASQAQKMEAVGQLTGGVAHDFNNLLTSILGTADLLSRRADFPERARHLLSVIIRAAERGASLTQRLLAFSRRQALEPHQLDVNRLAGGMSDLLRRTIGESIKIETILAGGLWRTFVDANQLESALLNLGINARDAMPEGGKLTIETGNTYLDDEYARMNAEVTAGQYVLIAVTDTGLGMTPEVMERAFEPFFTTKPEGRGTGLGLSQIYGFIKQSGGHIKIYSEPGEGTCVKLYLPRHTGETGTEEVPRRPDLSVLGKGEKILVVEDDDDVREYIRAGLIALGYRICEAPDAAPALEILAEQPDIVLLFTDLGLPGINGRRLAEEARTRRPDLKVVYTTGYARNAIVHNGLIDPGVSLLPKPFTVEAMGRKLRQVLVE